jgi:hypothetical protein
LKLNGTHQLLAYADDVNILGGSAHAVKENAEASVVATKEIGLEVNADKTEYMVMYRDQNAGQNHNIKTDNKSYDRVEHFKYLGTTSSKKFHSGGNGEEIEVRECLLIIPCRIFCLPICYPKIKRLRYTEL